MALLSVDNLTKRFGGLVAVDRVSFDVAEGEIVGLVGPNGAGKTTIFQLISGIYRPNAGEVTFDGKKLTGLGSHEVAREGVGRTFQIVKPFPAMTVLENAMVGAFLRTSDFRQAEQQALEVLDVLGLYPKRFTMARNLTLPDRKRLELAKALATRPRLLLLDEVMAGLTPAEVQTAIGLIRKVWEGGVTVLLIEHVMRAVMSLCHRVVVLNYGQLLAEGTPEQIAGDPRVIQAYLGEGFKLA